MNAYDPTLFTQERFEQWLDSQPMGRQFCYNDPSKCVLASFLREDLKIGEGEEILLVGPVDFGLNGEDYPLPAWALSLSREMADFVTVPGQFAYRPIAISDVKQLLTTLVNQNKLELNET